MRKITNMRKGLAITLLLAVTMSFIALAGCGQAKTDDSSASLGSAATGTTEALAGTGISNGTAQAATAADSTATSGAYASAQATLYPLTVKDATGYEMTIKNTPQHIISLTLGSDEILMGLVDKSRITALTKYADDTGISNVAKEAAEVPGRAVMDKSENIIAMKPDLIILDTWADANVVKQFRDAGINVYTFKTPSNIDEQKAVIRDIALLVGSNAKGKEITDWMDAKLSDVETKLASLKPEQKLKVMDCGELGSSGVGTNFDDIVTRAGLINVVSKAGMKGWPVVPKEKIIEFNPDIIILPSWYYDAKNSFDGLKNKFTGDASFQTVNAVKNDRIISVPNQHISAISQYSVLAVEDVARAAYPDLFK
ncbi:MAG TPA: ABC transporter substrate-binding protein [Clostridia bacterium]|nr:ABC transporter substrate-binding protein [Clostridia bacterium]